MSIPAVHPSRCSLLTAGSFPQEPWQGSAPPRTLATSPSPMPEDPLAHRTAVRGFA
ncbi:hypothetical protein T484DRAFT_1952243 [Baffinella frigidus]|nr:hypothetical protein T484DRAFT_1952243 [Cryptophyta sp. CCMP2293]